MSPTQLLFAFVLITLPSGGAATWCAAPGAGGAPEEVERLERRLIAAIAARDMDIYQEIVAEDYVATSLTREQTRSQIVAAYRSGALRYSNLRIEDVRVRVHGDAAVLTALSIRRENDEENEGYVRYMRVYARRNGRWQAVAQFAAPVAPSAK